MKQSLLSVIFSHPLAQLVSFSLILMSGEDFGAPYGWYIKFSLAENKPFAIVGAISMLLAFLSLFTSRWYLQAWGLVLMWLSLILFFMQLVPSSRATLFHGTIPLLSHLLFLIISALVAIKILK